MNLTVTSEFEVERPFVVYGAGHWRRSDSNWDIAVRLGETIARAGFTLVTGGYAGAMEAASEGARLGGGEAVGVLYQPVDVAPPNPFISRYHIAADYLERMAILLRVPHALALPGGSGTLAEIAAAVAMLRRFPGRHLGLWTPFWRGRLESMLQDLEPDSARRVVWIGSVERFNDWLDSFSKK